MRILLLLPLAFLESAQAALPKFAASEASCAQQMKKASIDAPSAASNDAIAQKCAKSLVLATDKEKKYEIVDASGEKKESLGTCSSAYQFLKVRQAYYANSSAICKKIESARAEAGSKSAEEAASAVLGAAQKGVTEMSEAIVDDLKAAEFFRANALKLAAEEHKKLLAGAATSAEAEKARVTGIADSAALQINAANNRSKVSSKEERNKLSAEALKLPVEVKAVGENVAASVELVRFITQLKVQQGEMQATATSLGIKNLKVTGNGKGLNSLDTSTTKTEGESGISSALKSALPFAPLALGAAALLMQQKNSSGAAANASAAQPLPTPSTNGYDLSKTKNAETKSLSEPAKSASLEDKSNSGASALDEKKADAAGTDSIAENSVGFGGSAASGYAPDPKAFSGALADSPIFGASSSAGGGSSGGSRKPGSLDEVLQLNKNGVPESTFAATGGGAPGYAGGGAHAAVDEASLKDMFKLDPLPPLGDAAAGLAAGGAPSAYTGLESFSEAGSVQGSTAIPGEKDVRSLFLRVKDYHTRCLKKGCVTNEAGGKL